MPVDVAVCLLAAEGEDVDPLGGDFPPHGLGNLVDQPLEIEILLNSEIARHLLAMLARGDKDVSTQHWILVQEHDRLFVREHDVMRVLRVVGDDLAEETRPGPGALDAAVDVDESADLLTFLTQRSRSFLVKPSDEWTMALDELQ